MKFAVISLVYCCCTAAFWVIGIAYPFRGEVTLLSMVFAGVVLLSTVVSPMLAYAAVVAMNIPKYMKVIVGIAGAVPPVIFVIAYIMAIRSVA